MANVSIQKCTPADIPACMEVISVTFKHDKPLVDLLFPAHETANGRTQGTERLTKQLQTDEDASFIKAVQESGEGEKIVGFAIWTHMVQPPPENISEVEDMEAVWPNKTDRAFMTEVWREYVGPRSEAVRQAEEGKGVWGKLIQKA